MSFEPQKFFIGLMDFFSILLPGALLTYLLKDEVGPRLLGNGYSNLLRAQGWIVFLFSAYLLGHFIFLLGSWLLDDRLYDPIRKGTYRVQVKQLADGKNLSSALVRWLAARLFKKDVDEALRRAARIKEHYLDPLNASSAINAFQWSKARLTIAHPEAMATVQRFEADSKFFRSLVVVLCALILWSLVIANRPAIGLISLALLPMAFLRYVDQRVKSTNQAYWYVITLESQCEGGFRPPTALSDGPSHAGGVVFRRAGDQVEYLLVQAKRIPDEWVLPKGHIERGEPTQETAVREVREETGVWARVRSNLRKVAFAVGRERVKVQFYLMEAAKEEKPSDRREHAWLPLDQAVGRATHQQSKELLRLADRTRTALAVVEATRHASTRTETVK